MEEILKLIIGNLVEDDNAVLIEKNEENDSINFKVKVKKDEMGKVIGKQGKVANSIRTVMKAVGSREKKKISVEFIDD